MLGHCDTDITLRPEIVHMFVSIAPTIAAVAARWRFVTELPKSDRLQSDRRR